MMQAPRASAPSQSTKASQGCASGSGFLRHPGGRSALLPHWRRSHVACRVVEPATRPIANGATAQAATPAPVQAPNSNEPHSVHSSIAPAPAVQVPKPRSGSITGPELGELHKRFRRLQNGSDIRGIAMDGMPNEPVTLTPGAAFFIGVGFAAWLKKRVDVVEGDQPRVAIGRDPRLTGCMMEGALAAGLSSAGVKVYLSGLATTPCMFYSILLSKDKTYEVQGSIMITASHMPWNAQGFKFFTSKGGLDKSDITEILDTAATACGEAGVMLGETWAETAHILAAQNGGSRAAVDKHDFRPAYASVLRQMIIKGVQSKTAPTLPLLNTRIAVDAGNGAGGFFATEVLAPLGADITGSRYLDPDGSFPNHIPNPENAQAMAAASEAVRESQADLGIVFDTDVDRSAIVDSKGEEINSNRFIALMSAIILRDHPGTTIVTDSVTSNGLTKFIDGLGGKHFRYKRGYKNVIGKGVELNAQGVETHLMMETSGHGAVRENHFLDDGAYLAVQVIIEAVRRKQSGQGDVGELLSSLAEPLESREVRVRITDKEHKPVGQKVVQSFYEWITGGEAPPTWSLDPVNHEGWRVNIDEGGGKVGWALLRQSLHDPLLVLNVESEVSGGAQTTCRHVLDFLITKCQDMPLDLSKLKN